MTMNTTDELATQLITFAEGYLGRTLSEDERQQLAIYRRLLDPPQPDGGGLAERARTQAARVIELGKQRIQATMQNVLEGGKPAPAQARPVAQTNPPVRTQRDEEDQAILKVVEAAQTLAQLRPALLQQARPGQTAAGHIVIAQIADRLANLVKAEVDACFERRFGPPAEKPSAAAPPPQQATASTSDVPATAPVQAPVSTSDAAAPAPSQASASTSDAAATVPLQTPASTTDTTSTTDSSPSNAEVSNDQFTT